MTRIGDILEYPLTGAVPCDGKPYRIVEHSAAYRELGKRYGAAGVGCFRVPDMPGFYVVLEAPAMPPPPSVLPPERFPLWRRKTRRTPPPRGGW